MKMVVFWDIAPCTWYIQTNISEELTASIIRVMTHTVSSSEMLVSIYQTTQHNIKEGSHLIFITVLIQGKVYY
jgi:hypothetical protein